MSLAFPLFLSSCASGDDTDARAVAERLLASVATNDGTAACALLAPPARSELEQASGRACRQAILEQGLRRDHATEVQVFNVAAQVRFAHDVVFLAKGRDGWRVTAAGCRPVADRPYDCRIQG
jgi:hypothetical protein